MTEEHSGLQGPDFNKVIFDHPNKKCKKCQQFYLVHFFNAFENVQYFFFTYDSK